VRALLVVCVLAALVVGVVWIGGDSLAGNMSGLQTEVGAPPEGVRWSVRRTDIWPATWQLIKEHPVAGVGFGGYWMAITQYHHGSGEKTPQEAHNDYLELAASGGIIGVSLGVWFVAALIRRARARLDSTDAFRRAACFGALVGIAGVAVHSFVDFGLHITVNAAILIALVVIATASVSARPAALTTDR
jgi:O-antigen ligase